MIGCIMRTRNDAQTRTLCGRAAEPSEFVFEDRKHALLYARPRKALTLSACEDCVAASIAIAEAEAKARV
jgi:hypothetical protein